MKKKPAYSQNMLHVDVYNIKRKKYKTVSAELAFAKITFDRMIMIFFRTCNVFFICYAVGLLQYSKSVWSKVRTLTVYRLINCILMPENCFRCGKSCKMYAIFTKVLRYLFNIFTLNNAIYMPRLPNLFHQHHVVLFILKILLFKAKDLNSKNMMWNHTKPETLPPIIKCVRCLCENILYRYQVTLIVLD